MEYRKTYSASQSFNETTCRYNRALCVYSKTVSLLKGPLDISKPRQPPLNFSLLTDMGFNGQTKLPLLFMRFRHRWNGGHVRY